MDVIYGSSSQLSFEHSCPQASLLSCQSAMVDLDILDWKEAIMLANIFLSFKSTVPLNGHVYQSPAVYEALITLIGWDGINCPKRAVFWARGAKHGCPTFYCSPRRSDVPAEPSAPMLIFSHIIVGF